MACLKSTELSPSRVLTCRKSCLSKVNIDGHKWDVFVNWPGRDKPIRPIMVAIQDIYSRKILSWRLDESENTAVTRMVFADLFRDYGIPKVCILDNGRAFASKAMTGGAKTRYRFKIKPDDPIGLLPMLGVTPQFATPYHGQAKPIGLARKGGRLGRKEQRHSNKK